LRIGYKEKQVDEAVNTKYFVLLIENHLNWKNHIEQMNPKLRGVCCAVRFMVRNSNSNILTSIYYAYFHSIMKYGILFGVTHPTVGRFSLYIRK
jgi:hypothetical protein